jgi:hypothetical protein
MMSTGFAGSSVTPVGPSQSARKVGMLVFLIFRPNLMLSNPLP